MNIYPGQIVIVKTVEELFDEFGYDEGDLRRGALIGNITFDVDMFQCCGKSYQVFDTDNYDNTLYLRDTNLWFSADMVKLASEPGEFFGFKVGDKVEFRNVEDMHQDGSIDYNWFEPEMAALCGTRGEITKIEPATGYMAEIWMSDDSGRSIDWRLDTSMVEHIDDSPDVSIEDWSAIAFA